MSFVSLNSYDLDNILTWCGKPESDWSDSELRTYEKLLIIQGMQRARREINAVRPQEIQNDDKR